MTALPSPLRAKAAMSPPIAAVLLLLLLSAAAAASAAVEAGGDPCPALSDGGGGASSSCPVKCFLTDAVCGEDGVTYWCGCKEAACAGVRVAKRGVCQVWNGGSGAIAGQAFLLVHIVFLIVLGFAFLFDVL